MINDINVVEASVGDWFGRKQKLEDWVDSMRDVQAKGGFVPDCIKRDWEKLATAHNAVLANGFHKLGSEDVIVYGARKHGESFKPLDVTKVASF